MLVPKVVVLLCIILTNKSVFSNGKKKGHVIKPRHLNTTDHAYVTGNVTHFFIERIFSEFGHNGHLDYSNFLVILAELGLQTGEEHHTGEEHDHEKEDKNRKKRETSVALNKLPTTYSDDSSLQNPTNSSELCLSGEEMLHVHHIREYSAIDETQFLSMCPTLIYQLLSKNCTISIIPEKPRKSLADIPASVWLYSSLSVLIISLVGLLGVAIIPIMQKVFYNHLLQFLVALAVGALSGDALLHLLPHALEGVLSKGHMHLPTTDSHSLIGVWIGVTGLSSIFFFFVMERILTIVTRIKNKQKKKEHESKELMEPQRSISRNIRMEELCHDCEKVITMMIHPNKELVEFAETALDESTAITYKKNSSTSLNSKNESHNGHSHGAHSVPSSVSAVAWMVILGDGIHNFSDGLAIGAGFANSLTVGVSTSIAVFCHELPHEIGDFAVLLRAGMKIKQAVVYNCLSSALCFIGMLIGVAIGNIETASLWIFSVVAGMFLYIALVDMLPEMTSVNTKEGENQFCHLFLQCLGMLAGSGIMFLIAFFEDDIKTMNVV